MANDFGLNVTMASGETINLKIQFGGGAELLFGNIRSHEVSIPAIAAATPSGSKQADRPSDITFLIQWMKDNMLKEREGLFVEGETVRPGILVLINDTDWELEGEGDYILQPKDEIVFISTLHGG
ncbi:Ubiquitin-related modifier 1 {ECO:0000255/HAMAP-Rule:MF_03048} [Serendipita indica DSM 11827]|uniref:Ubiquitin-related modifier 1 n=1 Tax=Serendipita indica (strain DSM 11827) TaxID=1109443 RepID=G4T8H2_SERID|nr:Ubiquitin-related modifier 1 {ECO:0000255/HAMAP-Rule:MF_03048} [Serendipita indica DSM 11827]CCA67615.1 related to ubiquitin related modifier URM1 [Serendipita indica DSM 11827]